MLNRVGASIESTARYLCIKVDDALDMAEQRKI